MELRFPYSLWDRNDIDKVLLKGILLLNIELSVLIFLVNYLKNSRKHLLLELKLLPDGVHKLNPI